jgi:hypothetical protein
MDVSISAGAVTLISVLMVSLAGAVSVLFKLLMLAKDASYADALKTRDARILDLEHERDAYKEACKDAMAAAEMAVDKLRGKSGLRPLASIPDVIPEHYSPVTKEQQDAADLATLRAQGCLNRELGIPPRTASKDGFDELPPNKKGKLTMPVPTNP